MFKPTKFFKRIKSKEAKPETPRAEKDKVVCNYRDSIIIPIGIIASLLLNTSISSNLFRTIDDNDDNDNHFLLFLPLIELLSKYAYMVVNGNHIIFWAPRHGLIN